MYFKELHDTISEEISDYNKLYDFLCVERGLITKLQSKELSINTSKKTYIINRLKKLNEKRNYYLEQIGKQMNISDSLSLKVIAEASPDRYKNEFLKLREEFVEIVNKVKTKNEYNRKYLSLSLARVKEFSNKIFSFINDESTYNHKGRLPNKDNNASLMNREA